MTELQMNWLLDKVLAKESSGTSLDSKWQGIEAHLRTKTNRPDPGEGEGGEGGGEGGRGGGG